MFVNSSFILSIFMYEARLIWQSSEARQSLMLSLGLGSVSIPSKPQQLICSSCSWN